MPFQKRSTCAFGGAPPAPAPGGGRNRDKASGSGGSCGLRPRAVLKSCREPHQVRSTLRAPCSKKYVARASGSNSAWTARARAPSLDSVTRQRCQSAPSLTASSPSGAPRLSSTACAATRPPATLRRHLRRCRRRWQTDTAHPPTAAAARAFEEKNLSQSDVAPASGTAPRPSAPGRGVEPCLTSKAAVRKAAPAHGRAGPRLERSMAHKTKTGPRAPKLEPWKNTAIHQKWPCAACPQSCQHGATHGRQTRNHAHCKLRWQISW
mmetsp:Transcript_148484/g.475282  ORF Transcript_148484/g.475282 Transcript_148484/m.475282 type:complete len:265 (-) Transcript_148484:153-947(-)